MTRSHCWDGDPLPYLTRIPINPQRTATARLLGNPHHLHGAVNMGFPGGTEAERPLWRLEADRYRPSLLVLSQTFPDYTGMIEAYGWPLAPAGAQTTKDYSPLLERLAVGQEYRFRVTANPVSAKRRPQKLTEAQIRREKVWAAGEGTTAERGVRGHRVAHRTAAHQRQWMIDQSTKRGFTIPETVPAGTVIALDEPVTGQMPATPDHRLELLDRQQLKFRKKRDTEPITITSVTYEGLLRISDLATFKQALLNGIGPNKAYGHGLLTIAPPRAETEHG